MDESDEMREMMQGAMRREQEDKLAHFRVLNRLARKGGTVFTGSSLMEHFPINELQMTNGIDQVIYNRGIGGFTTTDMLAHMDEMMFDLEPERIFINIGTNDIAQPDYSLPVLLEHYAEILREIQKRLPETEITLLAYYPVNAELNRPDMPGGPDMFQTRNNKNIAEANAALEKLAARMGCRFLNVNQGLTDEKGNLKAEYTVEGVHMYASGYQVVLNNLKPYL